MTFSIHTAFEAFLSHLQHAFASAQIEVSHRSSIGEFVSCKSSIDTRKYQNELLL